MYDIYDMKNMRYLAFLVLLITIVGFTSSAKSAADDRSYGLNMTANEAGFNIQNATNQGAELNNLIGTIVNTLLGLTGVIFMLVIIAAGDMWITAGGNEEKIKKAQGMIFNGVVGLAITFAAYLAAEFIIKVALTTVGL